MNLTENSFLPDLINHPQKISKLKWENISKIIEKSKAILKEENLLLKLKVKGNYDEVYVIGDIHGNLKSLMDLIALTKKTNPKFVIFLGDIVDRGPMQFECLLIVLTLKILFPLKYFILRGNHETLEMNQYYGFFQDFISRFNDQSKFNEILKVYNLLPIGAVVNESILCLHGGIPQDFDILKKLESYKCKDFNSIVDSIAQGVFQIMWNDPKQGLQGFSDSFRGSGIKFFGNDVFEDFLTHNNLKYLIRAHECFPEGFRWFFNKKLLSLFSSANYRGSYSPNPASYAIIKNNKIHPKLLEM
ncbi:MAG: metallophosphoesterase [Promethearchaeota archaeon]|nr:MAG: metallophosphoesterase [Candidatus Lokiarchaeota archaeon]